MVCILCILPLFYNSSTLFSKPFRTVSQAPTTIGTAVTLMHQCFLCSLVGLRIFLFLHFLFFFFTLWTYGTILDGKFFFFFLPISIRLHIGLVIRLYLKTTENVCVSFSRMDFSVSIYHLLLRSNFSFLHSFL